MRLASKDVVVSVVVFVYFQAFSSLSQQLMGATHAACTAVMTSEGPAYYLKQVSPGCESC